MPHRSQFTAIRRLHWRIDEHFGGRIRQTGRNLQNWPISPENGPNRHFRLHLVAEREKNLVMLSSICRGFFEARALL
jgi:hypothetical protein